MTSASPEGLVVKNGLNILSLDRLRNAGAVIANTDFNLISKVLRRSDKHRLEAFTGFRFSFHRGVEPVRYDIEQDARDLLRIDIRDADGRIEIALEGDTETCLFRPGTVVREVQALLEDCVDVRRTMLAVTLTGVLQHVFHDRVGTLTVLNNLFEVGLQYLRQFVQIALCCPV